jgi:hypothetical protein
MLRFPLIVRSRGAARRLFFHDSLCLEQAWTPYLLLSAMIHWFRVLRGLTAFKTTDAIRAAPNLVYRQLHHLHQFPTHELVRVSDGIADLEVIVILADDELDRLAGRFHGGGEVP